MSIWTQDRGFIGWVASRLVALTEIMSRVSLSLPLLLARLSIAAIFWQSGRGKMDSLFIVSDHTLFLFKNIYDLPLISAGVAAYLTAYAEQICAASLVVGLGARLGASCLLVITLIIQFFVFSENLYEFLSTIFTHMMWASLLLFIIASGPGTWSLDHLLFRSGKR